MSASTTARCNNCSAPATLVNARTDQAWCERCAQRSAAHEHGEVYAVSGILLTVIDKLRDAGLTDDEVLRLVRVALDRGPQFDRADGPMPAWAMAGFEYDDRFIRLDAEEGVR